MHSSLASTRKKFQAGQTEIVAIEVKEEEKKVINTMDRN